MFVGITNTPRDYAWGSQTAIAEILGRTPSGSPEAEYWLGTHPGSPARVVGAGVGPGSVSGSGSGSEGPGREGRLPPLAEGSSLVPTEGSSLAEVVTLPFLLKILAADAPLSLQAHPTREQARRGFDRENAAGVPLDSPTRNYRDAEHKPELIYALSESFEVLSGFRPVSQTRALLAPLASLPPVAELLERLIDDASLPAVFEWMISRGDGVAELVDAIARALTLPKTKEFATVTSLASTYPGDPGIVISLLLNRVTLARGEAIFLPAGNIHAYLSGVGIELMAASDNVLRGGLTQKHVDVAELLAVLDFTPTAPPVLLAAHPSPGVSVFAPPTADFELVALRMPAAPPLHSPAPAENEGDRVHLVIESDSVALCTEGFLQIVGARDGAGHLLQKGDAVFISRDEGSLTFEGSGEGFIATTRERD